MVCQKYKIKNIINEFIKALTKKITIEKVILFGSYAYGRPRHNSDIDIAIVSSKFKRMDDIKRIMLLSDIARKINTPKDVCLDPLGFTFEELENADYFNVAIEIKERGKVVYSLDKTQEDF